MANKKKQVKRRQWDKLAIALVAPLLVGGVGSLPAISQIPTWYVYLEKPFFNPPNWLFGPVWTVLYLLMGIALFLVWREVGDTRRARAVFWAQLVLNLGWTYLFFGAHLVGFALIEIVILLVTLVYTAQLFARHNHTAAWLLGPYIAWVTFAMLLNAAIFVLNT